MYSCLTLSLPTIPYRGKFGAGLNLTIAKRSPIFPMQPNFILARDHPHGKYDTHEKERPVEPPLTH